MSETTAYPTPYPDVNSILQILLSKVQTTLGDHFNGMYLDGSLVNGGFDEDSDIDFVVVTDTDINGDLFLALQTMHDEIARIDSIWAIQLEGSYLSSQAIRRYDPAHSIHPNIERGNGERLKMVDHNEGWAIHRYILRERGIKLAGPDLWVLIDPVSPADLRRAMQPILTGWSTNILDHPEQIQDRGYQSYTVLSHCRILYTLQTGDVASKKNAAEWVKATGGEKWSALIDRAWEGRHAPQLKAGPEDLNGTLDFIRYTLDRSRPYRRS